MPWARWKSVISKMRSRQSLDRMILITILLIGLIFRMYTTDFYKPINEYSDSSTYHYSALNLQKYGMLTNDRAGTAFREETEPVSTSSLMPGFPLFLSLLYYISESTVFVYSVQVALSMTTLILIYLIMRCVDIRFEIATLVLILAAVYPGFCYNLDFILTETLFTTLLTGFLYLFISFMQNRASVKIRTSPQLKLLIWANVLLMCAVMVRAQALPFIVIECFYIVQYADNNVTIKQRTIFCCVVLAVMLLFMMPLWIRNWSTFRQFWLLSEAGENPKIWGAQPYFLNMASTYDIELEELISKNQQVSSSTYWKWRVFGFFNFMWYDIWDENLVHPVKLLECFRLIHPTLIVPTVALIPALIKKTNHINLLLASVPLIFTLMCLPFHGLARYVFPSIPCVFILMGIILNQFVDNVKKKPRERVTLQTKWQYVIDKIFRHCYFLFSVVFSVILVFSVYVFDDAVKIEMSNYFLESVYEISVSDVEQLDVIETMNLLGEKNLWWVENVEEQDDGSYRGNWTDYPLMYIQIPETEATNGDEQIITEVELDISGGYLFDYCTIYWTGDNLAEYSENYVYGRFPRNSRQGTQIVYIPDDVSSLRIVPCGFRGAEFFVNSIMVTKYLVP